MIWCSVGSSFVRLSLQDFRGSHCLWVRFSMYLPPPQFCLTDLLPTLSSATNSLQALEILDASIPTLLIITCSPFTISLDLLLIVLQVHRFSTHAYVHHQVNLSPVPSHFSITHRLLEHFCAVLCSLSTFISLMCYFLCSIPSVLGHFEFQDFQVISR